MPVWCARVGVRRVRPAGVVFNANCTAYADQAAECLWQADENTLRCESDAAAGRTSAGMAGSPPRAPTDRTTVPSSWLISWSFAAWTVLSALAVYLLLIALSRLIGPRSFSQLTAFDFAVTVALGAVVGSTAAGAVGLPAGLLALASLFSFRGGVALLRRRGLSRWVDNQPLMLFRDGRFQHANLRRAKLTLDDVYEALRLNGTTHLDDVAAVIIERNGALSVLPRTGRLDDELLRNVVSEE